MDFLPTNWRTTLGGLLIAIGTGLQYAGQAEAGAILTGIGGLILGNAAPDKHVTKREVEKVKEAVADVKQDVRDVQQDVKEVTEPAPEPVFRTR